MPILHIRGRHLCKISAEAGSVFRYGFTESDDWISFRKDGDTVLIESTLSESGIEVVFAEFNRAVKEFVARVAVELGEKYPSLRQVDLMDEIVSRAEGL